jgi:two-component system OmpR family sensor kinase
MYEELAIKLSEKESLIKSFILFFLVIETFLIFIFYQYEKIEEEHLRENLFLELKNYSFFFDDNRFDMDIVPESKDKSPYELYMDNKSLYILVPMPTSPNDMLKVFYPKINFVRQLQTMRSHIFYQLLFLTLLAFIISLIFSFYALSPLRKSLTLLETFIKDIIHDLNTPISNILINLKMMDTTNEEVESISRSTKAISMLHNNLNAYLEQTKNESEKFKLKEIINEQVAFFAPMYDYLEWDIKVDGSILLTDRHTFTRIIYNLLSNACKYNTSNGFICIKTIGTTLHISNSSHGIKDPSKVFERFYKESERGLGIGLHIVKVLSEQLHIKTQLHVEKTTVELTLELSQVTLN